MNDWTYVRMTYDVIERRIDATKKLVTEAGRLLLIPVVCVLKFKFGFRSNHELWAHLFARIRF